MASTPRPSPGFRRISSSTGKPARMRFRTSLSSSGASSTPSSTIRPPLAARAATLRLASSAIGRIGAWPPALGRLACSSSASARWGPAMRAPISAIDGFDARRPLHASRRRARAISTAEFPGVPRFEDFDEALAALKPDAVAICTYTETTPIWRCRRSPRARMCFAKSRSPTPWPRPNMSPRRRARPARFCRSAISCASIPRGSASSRSAARSASRWSCA